MNSTGHYQPTSSVPISGNGTLHVAPGQAGVQNDEHQPKRLRVHANYHCGPCDKSYGDYSSLRRHERQMEHCERASTTYAPWDCLHPQCPKSFERQDLLKRHVDEVHLRKRRVTTKKKTHAQRADGHTNYQYTGQPYESKVAFTVNHAGPSIDQSPAGTLFSSVVAQHGPRINDLSEPLSPQQGQFQDIKYRSGTTVPALVGKDSRSRQLRFPRPCPLCQREFGVTTDDGDNADQHIRKHIKENHAMQQDSPEKKIMCAECDVQFWYDADLEWHLKSAERYKDCGFRFAHAGNQCDGHHPAIVDGQEHEDHRRFKAHLFAWGHSQHKTFVRYLGGYCQGNIRTNAPRVTGDSPKAVLRQSIENSRKAMFLQSIADRRKAMSRRSTGSLYSVQSQLSWLSTPGYVEYSATVRKPLLPALEEIAPYNAKDLVNMGTIKQALESQGDLMYDLACAFRRGQPQEFEQLLLDRGFLEDRFTEEADNQITTDSLRFKVDATWFTPPLQTGQIECLAILVESGMRISVETVGHFVTAFHKKDVLPYLLKLLDVSSYMTITSRLIMCAFCCAISRRDHVAFDNMLNAGVCVSATTTSSKPPLRPFMEALHRQYSRYPYSPSKMGGVKWTTDYMVALAIDAKERTMAKRLIKFGAGAYNILVRAAGTNDVETLQFLCDQGAHLRSQPCRQALGIRGSADVLHHLAYLMQFSEKPDTLLARANDLIDRNIDVNGRDDRDRTPLDVICSASPNIAGMCASNCHALKSLAFRLMGKLFEKSTELSLPVQIFSLLNDLEKRFTVDVGRVSEYERDFPSTEQKPSRSDAKQLDPFICSKKDFDRLRSRMEKLKMGAPRTTQIRLAAV